MQQLLPIKLATFRIIIKHTKGGERCINCYYTLISFLDNSTYRTSPETITLLTKQFPRWSLITLWFNEFSEKKITSSKTNNYYTFHTGAINLNMSQVLVKVVFVCVAPKQRDLSLIRIIFIEVLCMLPWVE